MEPWKHEIAAVIAYSLARFGHAIFNNDDGTRIYVAARRPVSSDSWIRYLCSGCARRLALTLGACLTTEGAELVRSFVEHDHSAEVN